MACVTPDRVGRMRTYEYVGQTGSTRLGDGFVLEMIRFWHDRQIWMGINGSEGLVEPAWKVRGLEFQCFNGQIAKIVRACCACNQTIVVVRDSLIYDMQFVQRQGQLVDNQFIQRRVRCGDTLSGK